MLLGVEIWLWMSRSGKGPDRRLDVDAIVAELHERHSAPCEATRTHVIKFIQKLERAPL